MALDIAHGLAHLSSKSFAHKNLCTSNVLLTEDMACKITNFGSPRADKNVLGQCRRLVRADILSQPYPKQITRCPVRWCAPEVVGKGEFSAASAVCSFGVMILELV